MVRLVCAQRRCFWSCFHFGGWRCTGWDRLSLLRWRWSFSAGSLSTHQRSSSVASLLRRQRARWFLLSSRWWTLWSLFWTVRVSCFPRPVLNRRECFRGFHLLSYFMHRQNRSPCRSNIEFIFYKIWVWVGFKLPTVIECYFLYGRYDFYMNFWKCSNIDIKKNWIINKPQKIKRKHKNPKVYKKMNATLESLHQQSTRRRCVILFAIEPPSPLNLSIRIMYLPIPMLRAR